MPDPKFEKQVQQKMEELKFTPSAAVWDQVEHELDKDKKRRRPLIWFFLFGGLLLAGGLYLAFAPGIHRAGPTGTTVSGGPLPVDIKPTQKTMATSPDKTDGNGSAASASGSAKLSSLSKSSGSRFVPASTESPMANQEPSSQDRAAAGDPLAKTKTDGSVEKEQIVAADEKNRSENEAKENPPAQILKAAAVPAGMPAQTVSAKENRMDSAIAKAAAKPDQKKKNRSWQFGLSLSPGISAIQSSLFHSAKVQEPPATIYSYNSSALFGGSTTADPSVIQPSFSFSAGISATKSFSRRMAISFALGYHYYSMEVKTGEKVNNPILINASSSFSLINSSYYPSGQEYNFKEYYHFLELPVTLEYRLNHRESRPVLASGGMIFSRNIGSNTLEYNKTTGIYYMDKDGISKTQVSANLGLLFGFAGGRNTVLFGPQLQYGLTNLLRDNPGTEQHLFFAGIRMEFRKK
jgi:hypothetical protein